DLFVLLHEGKQTLKVRRAPGLSMQRLEVCREAKPFEMMDEPCCNIAAAMPLAFRKLSRKHHAECHSLAMQERSGVARPSLGRMAKSVAKIEKRAVAGFRLVTGNDLRLHPAACLDGARESIGLTGENPRTVRFEPGKKHCIAQCAMFDDLGIAGP